MNINTRPDPAQRFPDKWAALPLYAKFINRRALAHGLEVTYSEVERGWQWTGAPEQFESMRCWPKQMADWRAFKKRRIWSSAGVIGDARRVGDSVVFNIGFYNAPSFDSRACITRSGWLAANMDARFPDFLARALASEVWSFDGVPLTLQTFMSRLMPNMGRKEWGILDRHFDQLDNMRCARTRANRKD